MDLLWGLGGRKMRELTVRALSNSKPNSGSDRETRREQRPHTQALKNKQLRDGRSMDGGGENNEFVSSTTRPMRMMDTRAHVFWGERGPGPLHVGRCGLHLVDFVLFLALFVSWGCHGNGMIR